MTPRDEPVLSYGLKTILMPVGAIAARADNLARLMNGDFRSLTAGCPVVPFYLAG